MKQILIFGLILCVCLANESISEEIHTDFEDFEPIGEYSFFDPLSSLDNWVQTKEKEWQGEFIVAKPSGFSGLPLQKGIVFSEEGKRYGYSTKFDEPLNFNGKPLVVQYEVKFQEGLMCGGAYLKLLQSLEDPYKFKDTTPYVIMFGPDRCGATNKVHFIYKYENPLSGEYQEHHLKNPPPVPTDEISHLYTLILRPDYTYSVLIDNQVFKKGSILEDFEPPLNPPKTIDDPNDIKPEDWVDEEYIADPDDVKPEDWDETAPKMIVDPDDIMPEDWLVDEEQFIPDPEDVAPEDWDEEEDGEYLSNMIPNPKCESNGCGPYEPKMIPNPAYKGPFIPKQIKNPAFKGIWAPQKIENPHYFETKEPEFDSIVGIGFDLFSMNKGVLFNNLLVCNDEDVAKDFAETSFVKKHSIEKDEIERLAKEQRKAAAAASHGKGIKGKFNYYSEVFVAMMKEYPTLSITVFFATLVMIIACYCRRNKKFDDVDLESDEEASEMTNDEATEDEEEEHNEENEENEEILSPVVGTSELVDQEEEMEEIEEDEEEEEEPKKTIEEVASVKTPEKVEDVHEDVKAVVEPKPVIEMETPIEKETIEEEVSPEETVDTNTPIVKTKRNRKRAPKRTN
eukprot:TRINITY_DN3149_c7_g1_i1.p1 TRINITY_DN3149_c7_g1~~TRINITY_DN3149_c7_g1_i1.p1  ORF type:complete len:623 (+),score=252.34 TRINITY_DN3149_c7_g1_i1:31-1899(+)